MTKSLDRRFRGLGRIKRSWGTDHKPTQRRLNEMVTVLFDTGRLDILKQIQSGELTPLQVYDAYRTNDLNRLPTASTLAPLKASMEKWIERKECSDAHRKSLMQSMRHLLSVTQSRSCVSGDLAELLTTLRERMRSCQHPRSFNLARAAAQAFVKSTQGRTSNLWKSITDVEPLKVIPTKKGRPISLEEMAVLTTKFKEKSRKPYQMNAVKHSDSAWAMLLSGMGPEEYWNKWHAEADRIHIDGTKRTGRSDKSSRVRDVPLISRIATPYATKKAFAEALKDIDVPFRVRPYDFRRGYANILEAAGIPRTRRRLYMGHEARDIDDLYERHQVDAFLKEDAAKLRAYVFGTESTGLKLEKA